MIRHCVHCGNEVYRKSTEIKHKNTYCSKDCYKMWHTSEARISRGYNVNVDTGCWEWIGGLNSSGYGAIKHKGKMCGAHRVSYEIYKGPITEGLFVCHSCDNPRCINPDHLWLGTASDNMQDCVGKGRRQGCSKGPRGPLRSTPEVIHEVRRYLSLGTMSAQRIAIKMRITRGQVINIRNGKRYADIK